MNKKEKIYIAGHKGMVGSAVWRALEKRGYTNLVGVSSKKLNLRNQQAVLDFYKEEKPSVVIDAAAKVGGILANKDYPYDFLMQKHITAFFVETYKSHLQMCSSSFGSHYKDFHK